MDLRPYVESLRYELAVAAEAGGEEARALAERLVPSLESAARLTLLDALSGAAAEITRDLAPGSVEVRLRGVDPSFVVTPAPFDQSFEVEDQVEPVVAAAPPPAPVGGDGGTSRINLRLPDHLKLRVEEAAGQAGLSINAWLVRAVAAALDPTVRAIRPTGQAVPGRQSYTGWAR
jgi:hypothetical protein